MKKLLRIISLLSVSVCALTACRVEEEDDTYVAPDYYEDGTAYVEIDDEDVDKIYIFKNDWSNFNSSRTTNSPIYQRIKAHINCDIYAQNTSYDLFETALGLKQAAGELPDIFLTNGPDNSSFFKRLLDNEDLLPISDWVNEEHYPNIYHYLQQFNFIRHNFTIAKGKHYYIPSSWHNEKSLFVRADWIRNLNNKLDDILVAEHIVNSKSEITDAIREQWKYKDPDTLLEFYRLARAFTIYDPDGNGYDDTYGYLSESNKSMDSWIYNAFDAGFEQFIPDVNNPGKYITAHIADGAKYATAFIARLMSEGYMSVDSLTGDQNTKITKYATGVAGMIYSHNWYDTMADQCMAKTGCSIDEVKTIIHAIEPPAGKNGTHGGWGKTGCWQGFCINKNMSNARIRKCLELYNYLLSDEGYDLLKYGVQGVHFDYDEQGNFINYLPKTGNGFYKTIEFVDTAAFLYPLVDWSMHYKSKALTFADQIVPRHIIGEHNSIFEDYPYIITNTAAIRLDTCEDYFEETISSVEKNEKNAYYRPSDSSSYNPKTFTWDNLYQTTDKLDSKWNSYVSSYLSDYYGRQIIDEYNDFIASGMARKVDPNTYIYRV